MLKSIVAGTMAGLGSLANGPDALYRSFVTGLGSDVQRATQQSTLQDSVTTNVDSLQAAASGVSYSGTRADVRRRTAAPDSAPGPPSAQSSSAPTVP